MRYRPALIIAMLATAAALALAGCGSSGSTAAATASAQAASSPSYIATAEASSDVGAEPSSGIGDDTPTASPTAIDDPDCTTHACIAYQMEQGLTGLVADDKSVSTSVKCYVSSVVYHSAADTYSASCVVTYSDGSTASGTGNLIESSGEVTFQPS